MKKKITAYAYTKTLFKYKRKDPRYARERIKNRKDRFFRHYVLKKGCKDCGIIGPQEIYEFDHIDGTVKKGRNPNDTGYGIFTLSLKKLFKALRKFDIICANCHNIRSKKLYKLIYM